MRLLTFGAKASPKNVGRRTGGVDTQSTLRAAASSASLNENNLKDYVEGVEDSGTKEPDPLVH